MNFGDKPSSGKDLPDTWKKMLGEYFGVSVDKAAAISAVYPTLNSLYSAYQKCRGPEECEALLAGIEVVSGNRVKSSRIGPSLSSRIYECMMSSDPTQLMRK